MDSQFLAPDSPYEEYEKRMNAKNPSVLSKKRRGNSRSELNTSDFGALYK